MVLFIVLIIRLYSVCIIILHLTLLMFVDSILKDVTQIVEIVKSKCTTEFLTKNYCFIFKIA